METATKIDLNRYCAKGSNEWVEVPASGSSTKGLKMPAALLEVLDVQAAGGHSH